MNSRYPQAGIRLATDYLGEHEDVTGGAVICGDEGDEFFGRIRRIQELQGGGAGAV